MKLIKVKRILAVLTCWLIAMPPCGFSTDVTLFEAGPDGRPVAETAFLPEDGPDGSTSDSQENLGVEGNPGANLWEDSALSLPEDKLSRKEPFLTGDEAKKILELYGEISEAALQELRQRILTTEVSFASDGTEQVKYEYDVARIIIDDYKAGLDDEVAGQVSSGDDPEKRLIADFYVVLEETLDKSIAWDKRGAGDADMQEFAMPEYYQDYVKRLKSYDDKVWSGDQRTDKVITQIVLPLLIILGPAVSGGAAGENNGPDPFRTILRHFLGLIVNDLATAPQASNNGEAVLATQEPSSDDASAELREDESFFSEVASLIMPETYQGTDPVALDEGTVKTQNQLDPSAKVNPLVWWFSSELPLSKDRPERYLEMVAKSKSIYQRVKTKEGMKGYIGRVMEMIRLLLGDVLDEPSSGQLQQETRTAGPIDPFTGAIVSGLDIVRGLMNQGPSLQEVRDLSKEISEALDKEKTGVIETGGVPITGNENGLLDSLKGHGSEAVYTGDNIKTEVVVNADPGSVNANEQLPAGGTVRESLATTPFGNAIMTFLGSIADGVRRTRQLMSEDGVLQEAKMVSDEAEAQDDEARQSAEKAAMPGDPALQHRKQFKVIDSVYMSRAAAKIGEFENLSRNVHPYIRVAVTASNVSKREFKEYLRVQAKFKAILLRAQAGEGEVRYNGSTVSWIWLMSGYFRGGTIEYVQQV